MELVVRLITIIVATLLIAAAAPAAHAQPQASAALSTPGQRTLGVGGGYLDTVDGNWLGFEPNFARKPTLNELQAALGGHLPDDFSIAFSCWVQPGGSLRDCRSMMAVPETVDAAALIKALAPLVTVTDADARMAISKEYRLNVRAALSTMGPQGFPIHCYPPYCISNDPPPAPPPPPTAKDPLAAAALKQANDCFYSQWDHSTELRFAADKAVRENQVQPPPPNVRAAVLDYVNSRTRLKKCIADLQKAEQGPPLSDNDKKAVDSALESMRFNYEGQNRYELAILIGLLDKGAGEAELSFTVP
jgi:hypothetical protein